MYDTKVGGYELIDEAAGLIREGEVVAFPTETVYGLGADATNEEAIKKIFIAKNRPLDNPFIVHLHDISAIEEVAELNEDAKKIFNAFSPGPITVVLKKKPCVPDIATANLDTVGIRIPSHPMAREFLKKCGRPIAAPSANLSKRVSPTECRYVYEDMNGRIPLILDGGSCEVGIESTVLSLAGEVPTVLRPGAITIEMIAKHLGTVKSHTGEVVVASSPGMKYTHYAPIVPCYLFKDVIKAKVAIDNWKEEGKKIAVLVREANICNFEENEVVSMGKTSEDIARNIFRLLRECEKYSDVIIIEGLKEEGLEASVMNRLLKSCGGKIL